MVTIIFSICFYLFNTTGTFVTYIRIYYTLLCSIYMLYHVLTEVYMNVIFILLMYE